MKKKKNYYQNVFIIGLKYNEHLLSRYLFGLVGFDFSPILHFLSVLVTFTGRKKT